MKRKSMTDATPFNTEVWGCCKLAACHIRSTKEEHAESAAKGQLPGQVLPDGRHLVAQKRDQRVVSGRTCGERLQAALRPPGEPRHALHRGRRQVKHIEVLAPARRYYLEGKRMR